MPSERGAVYIAGKGKHVLKEGTVKKGPALDLYVVRLSYTDDGKPYYTNARPCFHCLEIIRQYRCARIFYTLPGGPGELKFGMEKMVNMKSTHVSAGIQAVIRKGEINHPSLKREKEKICNHNGKRCQ